MSRTPEMAGDIDATGWLTVAARMASPNCDPRPMGAEIRLLVLHSISLPPGEFGGDDVLALFLNRLDTSLHPYYARLCGQRVSAHFLIRRDGRLIQFVPCTLRAWHAGASCWRGAERCNDFSLGIELEGDDFTDFADPQYEQLAALIAVLRRHYPLRAIVGHADIAPGRKTDPGPYFEWSRVATD